MKKTKYLLLIISISIFCLILAGCAVSAKYSTALTKDIGVADFIFDNSLIHPDIAPADNICDLCGKQLCDHTERENHPAVPHTCTVDGTREYWSCNGCDLLFDAASGGNTVTLDDLVDPASHSFVDGVCTVCGDEIIYGGYINWVNGKQFESDSEAKFVQQQIVHSSLPRDILPTDRILYIGGWMVMQGDITSYGFSVDGGASWTDITASNSFGAGTVGTHDAIVGIQGAAGSMEKAVFNGQHGMKIDLSRYLGQTVNVTVGAKGGYTGETYIPFVTINNVCVKTGFAANIAAINGDESYGSAHGTHLTNGILHQNVVLDQTTATFGGWVAIIGGASEFFKYSVDGIEWKDANVVALADGTNEHLTSAVGWAGGTADMWNLSGVSFRVSVDLSQYAGKTVNVMLGRVSVAASPTEIVHFATNIIHVPGTPSHECTSNNWTNNGNGTHTGYCAVCSANVTETCSDGDWSSDGTQHWKACSKCGHEVDGTRGNHGVSAQTNCDEAKTCPVCNRELQAAGSHTFTGTATSNGLAASTHTIQCSAVGCSASITEACTGGTAYCNTNAACDVCGGAHGAFAPDNHKTPDTTIFVNNGDGTHTEKYDCCKAEIATNDHTTTLLTVGNGTYHVNKCTSCDFTENVNCSGGSANCQNKAVCSVCSQPYGEVNGGVHAQSTTHIVDNGNGTHSELYDCCNALVSGPTAHTTTVTTVGNGTYHVVSCTACSYTGNINCSGGSATCTAQAVCSECNKAYGTSLGHNFATYVSNGDATCQNNRTETAKCTRCDETDTRTVANSTISHNYTSTSSTAYKATDATCQAAATYYKTCTMCGAKGTGTFSSGDKIGHNYTSTSSTAYKATDATCTTPATYYKTCTMCSGKGTETFTSGGSLGHTGGTATCQTQATCTRCGVKYGNYGGHSHTNSNKIADATCTSAATYQWTCKWCGNGGSTYPSGSALGHSYARSGIQVKCSRCADVIANGYFVGTEIGQSMGAGTDWKEDVSATGRMSSHVSAFPWVSIGTTNGVGFTNFYFVSGTGMYCLNFGGATGKYIVVQYHMPPVAGASTAAIQGCTGSGYINGAQVAGTTAAPILGFKTDQTVKEMVISHQGFNTVQIQFMAICDNRADANALMSWLGKSFSQNVG